MCRSLGRPQARRCWWWFQPRIYAPVWSGGRLLRDLGHLEGLRLLRGVRVLGACVNLQFGQLGAAQAVLGQHALYRFHHGALGVLLQQFRVGGGVGPSRVAGVAVGLLLLKLRAGEGDLVRVDDDDEVAAVHVGSKGGLVLTTKKGGNLSSQSAENNVGRVNDVQVSLDRSDERRVGTGY